MQKGFESAFYSGNHKCLGLHLEPLTLGHLFALYEHHSSFVVSSEEGITADDLFKSVFLCTQTWQNSRKDINRWWVKPAMSLWTFTTRKLALDDEALKFWQYIEENLPVFEKWVEGDVSMGAAPTPVLLMAAAMNRLHLSMKDAMNASTSQLICLLTALSEHEGKIKLVSQEDLNFRKWAEDQYAERAKQKEFVNH